MKSDKIQQDQKFNKLYENIIEKYTDKYDDYKKEEKNSIIKLLIGTVIVLVIIYGGSMLAYYSIILTYNYESEPNFGVKFLKFFIITALFILFFLFLQDVKDYPRSKGGKKLSESFRKDIVKEIVIGISNDFKYDTEMDESLFEEIKYAYSLDPNKSHNMRSHISGEKDNVSFDICDYTESLPYGERYAYPDLYLYSSSNLNVDLNNEVEYFGYKKNNISTNIQNIIEKYIKEYSFIRFRTKNGKLMILMKSFYDTYTPHFNKSVLDKEFLYGYYKMIQDTINFTIELNKAIGE